jgi:dethiobiotin synthetase/adenosylmethionine--8-amino-7-oxononanoate aminotransferase
LTISTGYGSYTAEHALASLKRPSGGAPTINAPLEMDKEDLSVHFRTLGNVGYLICSLNSEKRMIRELEERLLHIFQG